MATVVGIFEDCYINKKKLPIVRPGTQSRRFTHVTDTVEACYQAWIKNKNAHYAVASKKSYSIIDLAKLFKCKVIYLPPRKGERYSSSLNKMNLNNKIYRVNGKIELKNYIKMFIERNNLKAKP